MILGVSFDLLFHVSRFSGHNVNREWHSDVWRSHLQPAEDQLHLPEFELPQQVFELADHWVIDGANMVAVQHHWPWGSRCRRERFRHPVNPHTSPLKCIFTALPCRACVWMMRLRCSVAGKLSPLASSISSTPWSDTYKRTHTAVTTYTTGNNLILQLCSVMPANYGRLNQLMVMMSFSINGEWAMCLSIRIGF